MVSVPKVSGCVMPRSSGAREKSAYARGTQGSAWIAMATRVRAMMTYWTRLGAARSWESSARSHRAARVTARGAMSDILP